MGKTIKRYHYMPILDDRNINDQGIDANGASTAINGAKAKYVISLKAPASEGGMLYYFEGLGTHATYANSTAEAKHIAEGKVMMFGHMHGFATANPTYATITAAMTTAGWTVAIVDDGTVPDYGNLYGSSKDVGTIMAKIPMLSETGGRVN
jgi:hypothetical protein